MNHFYTITIIAFVLCLHRAPAQTTHLRISKAASELSFPLANVRKLTFANQEAVLGLKAGNDVNTNLSSIAKIYFSQDVLTEIASKEQEHSIFSISPNPAHDELHIRFLKPSNTTTVKVKVMSVQGAVVYEREHPMEQELVLHPNTFTNDIPPKGIYLVQLIVGHHMSCQRIILL